jgi:hypothetical protein
VWEVLSIIKENMPAYFDFRIDGPLISLIACKQQRNTDNGYDDYPLDRAMQLTQNELHRRLLSCSSSLFDEVKDKRRQLSLDEVLDLVFVLNECVDLKDQKGVSLVMQIISFTNQMAAKQSQTPF